MNSIKIEQILKDNEINIIDINLKCDTIKTKIYQNSNNSDAVSLLVRESINDIKLECLGEKLNHTQLNSALENYILNNLHDSLTPVYYKTFKDEDNLIFQKCLSLRHVKFSLIYGDINLPASIVELASLDSHKTVQGKMGCLTTCYDMIFAELKLAMAELIAEHGGECSEIPGNIPIVNNADITHILVEVILRAKCQHLYSNLYFVQSLSDIHILDKQCEHVLGCFSEAVELLMDISEQTALTFRKSCSEMDLTQYSCLMQRLDESSISNSFERMSLTRISRQISKSHEYVGNF